MPQHVYIVTIDGDVLHRHVTVALQRDGVTYAVTLPDSQEADDLDQALSYAGWLVVWQLQHPGETGDCLVTEVTP